MKCSECGTEFSVSDCQTFWVRMEDSLYDLTLQFDCSCGNRWIAVRNEWIDIDDFETVYDGSV
jgi:hypothetical protein